MLGKFEKKGTEPPPLTLSPWELPAGLSLAFSFHHETGLERQAVPLQDKLAIERGQ